MKKHILLAADASYSSGTQQAVRAIAALINTPLCKITLLTVLPTTHVITAHPGIYMNYVEMFLPTADHYKQAEEVQNQIRLHLTEEGYSENLIESIICVGVPGDEILRVARDLPAHVIVLISRGNSYFRRLRRLISGSITEHVQRAAPCPVLQVSLPSVTEPVDVVSWYSAAVKRDLQKNPERLTVLTPEQVAQRFMPPQSRTIGQREHEAAARALEDLAQRGVLIRRDIQGEIRYIND